MFGQREADVMDFSKQLSTLLLNTDIAALSKLLPLQEKPKHQQYLSEFRTKHCRLFLEHKCHHHRPFTCFHWHFPNQMRRQPIRRSNGTFSYNPDVYCTTYDENTGICPQGEECPYVHRNAGDTERRYHPRYYKTGICIYETTEQGHCAKNGLHCAFAHGPDDLRVPTYDIRELQGGQENGGLGVNLPASLEKERVLSEDPKWNDMHHVLAHYKTTVCQRPPRMCRQGYACPFYHNNKDRRRPPSNDATGQYRSTPCPQVKPGDDWLDSNLCDSGDSCSYCHSRTEQQFHPEIYKSTKCNDMLRTGYCPRGTFCAFAHEDSEMGIGRDFLLHDLNSGTSTGTASTLGQSNSDRPSALSQQVQSSRSKRPEVEDRASTVEKLFCTPKLSPVMSGQSKGAPVAFPFPWTVASLGLGGLGPPSLTPPSASPAGQFMMPNRATGPPAANNPRAGVAVSGAGIPLLESPTMGVLPPVNAVEALRQSLLHRHLFSRLSANAVHQHQHSQTVRNTSIPFNNLFLLGDGEGGFGMAPPSRANVMSRSSNYVLPPSRVAPVPGTGVSQRQRAVSAGSPCQTATMGISSLLQDMNLVRGTRGAVANSVWPVAPQATTPTTTPLGLLRSPSDSLVMGLVSSAQQERERATTTCTSFAHHPLPYNQRDSFLGDYFSQMDFSLNNLPEEELEDEPPFHFYAQGSTQYMQEQGATSPQHEEATASSSSSSTPIAPWLRSGDLWKCTATTYPVAIPVGGAEIEGGAPKEGGCLGGATSAALPPLHLLATDDEGPTPLPQNNSFGLLEQTLSPASSGLGGSLTQVCRSSANTSFSMKIDQLSELSGTFSTPLMDSSTGLAFSPLDNSEFSNVTSIHSPLLHTMSPFSNAVSDLEQLHLEQQLEDYKRQLNSTKAELETTKQQRDMALMKLYESSRILHSLTSSPTMNSMYMKATLPEEVEEEEASAQSHEDGQLKDTTHMFKENINEAVEDLHCEQKNSGHNTKDALKRMMDSIGNLGVMYDTPMVGHLSHSMDNMNVLLSSSNTSNINNNTSNKKESTWPLSHMHDVDYHRTSRSLE